MCFSKMVSPLKKHQPSDRRFVVIKLASFSSCLFFLIICLVGLGVSWRFISTLIHPDCKNSQPLKSLPDPEEHWLSTLDGYKIKSWFYPPKNGAVIMVLGGLDGSLEISNLPLNALLKEGFGLLLLDSRSCALPPAPVTLGGNELFDSEAALNFLLNSELVDLRIGVWGFSMGGATAIRLAARHQEINAIIRDGGYTNLGELLAPSSEGKFFVRLIQAINIQLFQWKTGLDPWQISPIDDLDRMSSRPILFIYAETEADDGIEQYLKAKEPKSLWIVPESNHGLNYHSAPDFYEDKVLSFFKQHLLEEPIE